MYMCLARAVWEVRGRGEWIRGLCLALPILWSRGVGGLLDMCLGCGGVCGVSGGLVVCKSDTCAS